MAGLRADAGARAARACITDEAMIEADYLRMLAGWLTSHEQATCSMMPGGAEDAVNAVTMNPETLAATRLAAERHHAMISDFCSRHAEAFLELADEIDPDMCRAAIR